MSKQNHFYSHTVSERAEKEIACPKREKVKQSIRRKIRKKLFIWKMLQNAIFWTFIYVLSELTFIPICPCILASGVFLWK